MVPFTRVPFWVPIFDPPPFLPDTLGAFGRLRAQKRTQGPPFGWGKNETMHRAHLLWDKFTSTRTHARRRTHTHTHPMLRRREGRHACMHSWWRKIVLISGKNVLDFLGPMHLEFELWGGLNTSGQPVVRGQHPAVRRVRMHGAVYLVTERGGNQCVNVVSLYFFGTCHCFRLSQIIWQQGLEDSPIPPCTGTLFCFLEIYRNKEMCNLGVIPGIAKELLAFRRCSLRFWLQLDVPLRTQQKQNIARSFSFKARYGFYA